MSTIYTFHQECTALTAATLAEADEFLIFDASANVTKNTTGADVRTFAGSGLVNTTATSLTVTAASHAGRTVTISSAAPIAVTLPAATGTGAKYRFVFVVAATGTASTIAVANATDVMIGQVLGLTTSSDNVIGYKTSATSDTISVNGTTKGGDVGDWFEITDVAAGKFLVSGVTKPTGSVATPFSASVA